MKKHYSHIIFIIFFLTAFILCGYAQTGTLKGKVQGSEGVLQAATVSLGSITLLTDKNGVFSLSLKPGTYTISISHIGYKKIIQEIKIEAEGSLSFDFILVPLEYMEDAVMIGSRSVIQRSKLNTTVPVDIILPHHLVQTGQINLTQMLNFVAPSFNVSRQLVNEPITLRGLDPDHVLIMVNGTRYHNMAYLNDGRVRGMLGRGSVANDLNSIPFSAIEKIEILRDGASAQYGSDAIAGVINIHLKESTGKTSIQLHAGQFYINDGEKISFGINHGFPIGKKLPAGRQGFLNFSADYRYSNSTFRGGEYKGTVYINNPLLDDSIIMKRNFNRTKVSNAGTSQFSSGGILINGGYHIRCCTEVFWTAMFNSRKSIFIGTYIFPKNTRQVNSYLFPDGFKPNSIQNVIDIEAIAGIKGETKNKWHWEYSSTYGSNGGKYYSENTNNASQYYTLGKNAPTGFYTGALIFQKLTNNFNFAKDLVTKNNRMKLFNIAFGGEWRLENYKIRAGEEAAWQNYDQFQRKQGGSQNGLIFRPDNVANENRNVFSSYIDVESEFATHILIDLAARYEYYDDFGDNFAGKIAALYKFSDKISVRSSLSTGFRAPGLQQRYISITSKGFVISGGALKPVTSGIYNNDSEIAKAFGVPSLRAEKSVNLNVGFITRPVKHLNLTVDAYWIQIRNRVVLSGRFEKATNSEVQTILSNYPEIDQVQFFSNAINTRTLGLDIVMNGNWKINKDNLSVMFATNFTHTSLFGEIQTANNLTADSLNTNTLFNREERTKVEKGQPNNKTILFVSYEKGRLAFQVRNTRFGKTSVVYDSKTEARDEFFSPKILTDFSIIYTAKKLIAITMGVNNIFNVYPDPLKNLLNTGEGMFIYSQEASPFGFNGGYYFVSMAFNF